MSCELLISFCRDILFGVDQEVYHVTCFCFKWDSARDVQADNQPDTTLVISLKLQ